MRFVEYGYILKMTNKSVYKEIQLPIDCEIMKIGMDISCDVRLYKEDFFEAFRLDMSKQNGIWQMVCSDNAYIDAGDVRKLVSKSLNHGDFFSIKYRDSDLEIFRMEFQYDFDNINKNYDRTIDISGINEITIGSEANNKIVLNSQYVKNDSITLQNQNDSLRLIINRSSCGVYHNGKKASDNEIIKNYDFISVADFSFYYKNGKLMTEDLGRITTNLANTQSKLASNYPRFKRNTRVNIIVNDEKIEVLDPPSKPQKPKNNLISRLLPSVIMIVAGVAMVSFSPFMLVSSGIGVITAITSLVQGKREFKQSTTERLEKYNNYINNKRKEIELFREEEKKALNEIYISVAEEINNFEVFSENLFDRTPADDDFLTVRLGIGDVRAKRAIDYKSQEKLEIEDDLQEKPKQLYDEYKYIHESPVICDLKSVNAIGIIGQPEYRFNIMKNLVIDICARQFQSDVKLFFVAEKENKDKVDWLRILPYVYNDKTGIRNIVCDDESKNIVFEYLYKELTEREKEKGFSQRYIVFLYDEYGFKNHPISKFVEKAKDLGITFVFFGDTKEDISIGCNQLIFIRNESSAQLVDASDRNKSTDFIYTTVSNGQAERIVEILAPVYTEQISLESTLTKNISIFKLLNILTVEDIDLEKNWSTSQVYNSMAAPLGVSKSGIVTLDLHDKAHGPHGLVAGTTGSGKSEILQTYILSMAILYHPHEVGFVIIDFKGGGMVNQFRNLPHLIGAITNIDGKEIDRSLKSIKAELQKRQRLFAEADVNHIDKYIRKYKAGETDVPLPHLIIIVDEFAELRAEQPEFMKELISAARIGRSLGVHLILATQKPSGQVDDQIWSNSRFKLCLKVQDQQDSNEVLKSPLAAEIKEPGRAYLQVGNNEIFELFQSAYSGAPEKMDDTSVKEFTIKSVSPCRRRVHAYTQKRKKVDGVNTTQLDAIVDYVRIYSQKADIKRLPNICLPPLEKLISVPSQICLINNMYPIGIYDDPNTQYQGEALFDFDSNNTIVIGASQTGKTNLLQLLIREISSQKKATEANFYILDFGSMILKNFENLNHVGGVVVSSEEERLKNLFKLLLQELDMRKEKLMSVGVSSISSYNEVGYNDIPHIYLLLDNFAAFREMFAEKYEDDFLFIAREGITYGISLVVTAATTSGFGYKYMSNFANHIAFNCNDNTEYSNMFDRCKIEPSNVSGRMLVCFNKVIYEAQSYLSFDGEKEIERITAIKEFIEEQNQRNIGLQAKIIPEVPDMLDQSYIQNNFMIDVKNQIAVALNYQHVEPVYFDIASMSQLTLVGKQTANMLGFEKALISEIKVNYFERLTNVYIIDSISRDLVKYAEEPFVEEYSIDYSILSTIFESVTVKLEKRYSEVLEYGLEILDNKPLLFILINNISAIEYISTSKELMTMYTAFITKYKAMKVMLVFGGINDENIGYSSCDLLKKLKENKNAVIFTNIADHKVFDVPAAFIRQNKKPIDATQGYYLKENEIVKIRFAKEE